MVAGIRFCRQDWIYESVKLTQVAMDLLIVQSCTVCLGARCDDERRQLVMSSQY